MANDAPVDALLLRDAVITKWVELVELDGTPTSTIMATVAVHEVLRRLCGLAVREGSGVVSEYELRELLRPLTRAIREREGVAGD